MLTCTNCGASVREGARFCTSCGTRLNDPISPQATSVWSAPVVSDAASSSAAASAAEPASMSDDDAAMRERAELESGAAMAPAPDASEHAESGADEPAEPASRTEDGFTWSWGTSANAESDGASDPARQVDEESGVVLEETGPEETEPDSGAGNMVDATEIDILEPDQPGTDADESGDDVASDVPAPETGDTMLVVEEETAGEQGESETLAAWAGQWDAEGEMAGNDEPSETTAEEPDVPNQPVATGDSGPDQPAPGDAGEEDTVAKAERLIGELRSIIPTLARPMPAPAASLPDPSPLADELEGAARAGQFDDLRETLQSARERPRDVDTMLSLSAKVDRLLELLDDRDNLARTAESAATRLRPGSGATDG